MPPSPTNLPSLRKEDSPLSKLLPMSHKTRTAPSSSKKHQKTPNSAKKEKKMRSIATAPDIIIPQGTVKETLPKLTIPDTSPTLTTATTVTKPDAAASNFQEALTSIPLSIVHTSDMLYILCQLRRGRDQEVNNHLATMHNDESIFSFIPTLITTAFQQHPSQPSISGGNLIIREIKFVSIKNHVPTYSIAFSTIIQRMNDKPLVYARQGTPKYTDMQEYIHDFVFEKWHTLLTANLEVPENVLKAITMVIPPCNFPKSKPIAFLSGLPPQVFGRKYFHAQFIQRHIHTLIKPLLPGNAAIHNYAYFQQAFGLQVRRNYKFTDKEQEEIYIAHMSNMEDFELISKIIFPSTTNAMPLLPTLNLPVSFIPIPIRPTSRGSANLTQHYKTLSAILSSIRNKHALFNKLKFITTHIFKDPAASTTRQLLLTNKNVITYAILHSAQKGINTRIYVRNENSIGNDIEDSVRSWFLPTDHTILFFSRTSKLSKFHTTTPSLNTLQTVVKNLDSSLLKFAEAMGVTSNDIQTNDDTISDATTENQPTSTITITPVLPIIPTLHRKDTHIQPAYISPNKKSYQITTNTDPPQIPIFEGPTKRSSKKRTLKQRSPSPIQSDTASIQSMPSSPKSQAQSPSSQPSDNESNDNNESENDDNDEEDSQDSLESTNTSNEPTSNSIHIDGIKSNLRTSIPTDLQIYVEDKDISKRAYDVYEADDYQESLLLAKQDLRKIANKKAVAYEKYKAKTKKKERSSKKKKSLKASNPYLI